MKSQIGIAFPFKIFDIFEVFLLDEILWSLKLDPLW